MGFGHITRCIALYQAFCSKRLRPEFIINADDSVFNLLKGKKCEVFNWVKGYNRLFGLIKTADFVVIDSYLAKESLYDKISDMLNGKVAMIDDYNRLNYPRGIVVNPSIYGDKLNYSQKDEVLYLLGRDYIILRKEFWSAPRKKINKEIRNVFLTFGGMNHSELFYEIDYFLKKDFNFKINYFDNRKNRLSTSQMLRNMLNADLCISGGGQTTYELARIGVPAIGICFADNQIMNLKAWQEKGFIAYVGRDNDKNLSGKLLKAVKKIMPYNERVNSSNSGRENVDGKGVLRLVAAMLKNIKNN